MVMGKVPKDPQFMDAYEKLSFGGKQMELANRMAQDFLKQNGDYRMTTTEAPAFAIGNMVGGRGSGSWPAPDHIDPTMATEFSVLLDLANRAQRKAQK